MSSRRKLLTTLCVLLLLWLAGMAWDYFDPNSVAHQSMQYHLKLFGTAMYEYHAASGKWPSNLDDLTQTALPQKSPYWRQAASTMVFLWPKDLKPDPKDNAGVPLVYDRGGIFNNLGKVWVCWGDLRTEHVRERDLLPLLSK